jgi:hypothetical protein
LLAVKRGKSFYDSKLELGIELVLSPLPMLTQSHRYTQTMLLVPLASGLLLAQPLPARADRLPATCPAPLTGKPFARSELFFGLSKPNGGNVTLGEFQRFLDREVTPRFPDGLTLLSGFGQFKNAQGKLVQERSQVLILLYPLEGNSSHEKIEQIRQTYKAEFKQESVLRVDSVSCVEF